MELKLSPRIAIDFFFLLAFFDPYGDFLLFLLKLNREFTAKVRALCLYVGKGKKKTTNAVNLSKKNRWKAIRDLPPRPCPAALCRPRCPISPRLAFGRPFYAHANRANGQTFKSVHRQCQKSPFPCTINKPQGCYRYSRCRCLLYCPRNQSIK